MQGLIRELISAGYIVRLRQRDSATNRFGCYEYVVYDEPQSADRGEPQPENPVVEKNPVNAPQPDFPEPGKPAPENTVAIVNTDYSKSLREHSASEEAGADAPSVNKLIWKEALILLETTSLPEAQCRKLVGRWCMRTPSEENKQKLLAIVRAAQRAGTQDPVAYIAKAMNDEFPAPPDPKGFTAADWKLKVQAAINTKQWVSAWGPAPGRKGCLVPPALISEEILHALPARVSTPSPDTRRNDTRSLWPV